ncbi:MAG: GNAT family N-acetyltransferase [Bacillus sp. (in: firmicutes)]
MINKENNTIIGVIGYKGTPNSVGLVEIDYGIGPSEQSKGYVA